MKIFQCHDKPLAGPEEM